MTVWDHLFEFLVGFMNKKKLEEAGARPDALAGSVTMTTNLPTFSAPNPEPPTNLEESRSLSDCHPELVRRYLALKGDFEAQTGRQLFETCIWRSQKKQQKLYQVGRRNIPGEKILTQIDGVNKKSRHNVFPSEAIDVCVDADPGPGKHPVWDESAYHPLIALCEKHGLVSGGSWSKFKDWPHIELPAEATWT